MVTKGGLLAVLLLSALMAAPGPPGVIGRTQPATGDPAQEPAPNRLATTSKAQSDPPTPIAPKFQVGEKLVFEVKFKSFPVYATIGEITMEYLGPQADPQIPGIRSATAAAQRRTADSSARPGDLQGSW
jgi:hypothetical protein